MHVQAEKLSDAAHNLTSQLPMLPTLAMPPMPSDVAMPLALGSKSANGNMNTAGPQVLGAWDVFSNLGKAVSNFMSTTLHISVGT